LREGKACGYSLFELMTFPARLHVLLARDASVGIVIRRGPSRRVCTVRWDQKTDLFELGQWFRGRIYERRCDLSPDGKYLIYFAMNGRWESETKGAWTAISRAPYLKAITLLGKGDCWHGGGLFTGKKAFWVNDGHGHTSLHESPEVRRDVAFTPQMSFGGECLNVYYPRLMRDGWRLVTQERKEEWHSVTNFEKELEGGWCLRKRAHEQVGAGPGHGCYWDEHRLIHAAREVEIDGSSWEWADVVGTRFAWAEAGQLHAGYLRGDELRDCKMLHDFNGMKFTEAAAPY
jgi:hypothetical protein